LNFFSVSQ
jgi:hypothetical protein